MFKMLEEQLSFADIINCLSINYGIKSAKLSLLPMGADANASVYKVNAANNTDFFLKIRQGQSHDTSVMILELLHQAGIQQIILPIKTIEGHATTFFKGFTFILYLFVEGQNAFTHNLNDEQWFNLGKTLRKIHEINVSESIQNQLRYEAYSSQWRDAVRAFYSQNEIEPVNDEIALNFLEFMKENKPTIQRLVDRAEELSQKILDLSSKFVLCHSDIHGGNVLVDRNDAIFIIDWDDPIMAPKERDLMFIGGGVANVWNKAHEEKLFYEGYGMTEINSALLAYYRLERIVEDIALFTQSLLFTSSGFKDRLKMYNHFLAMFEPNGVVDIAFKTDIASNI